MTTISGWRKNDWSRSKIWNEIVVINMRTKKGGVMASLLI
jgi:hypothetical protein